MVTTADELHLQSSLQLRKDFSVMVTTADERTAGGNVEIRLELPMGQLLSSAQVGKASLKPIKVSITATTGFYNLFLVFTNSEAKEIPLLR